MRSFWEIFHQGDMVIFMQLCRIETFFFEQLFSFYPFAIFKTLFAHLHFFFVFAGCTVKGDEKHNYKSLLRFQFSGCQAEGKVLFLGPSLYFFSLSHQDWEVCQSPALNFDWSSSAGCHYSHYALTAAAAFLFKGLLRNPFSKDCFLFALCFKPN